MNEPQATPTPPSALLLTGPPGIGKTTLIRAIVRLLPYAANGFYTLELRDRDRRIGFELVTLSGERAMLAHRTHHSECHVAGYGVNIETLTNLGIPAIRSAITHHQLAIIDEIGKMELYSKPFRAAITDALRSNTPMLGTILSSPHPWADHIKSHPRVRLLPLTRPTWRGAYHAITEWLQATLQISLPSCPPSIP